MSHLAQFRTILNNGSWLASSRLLFAAIKFVTVPLLLTTYGKNNYGVLALATALNGYLQILALGIPTGMTKHVAAWLAKHDMDSMCAASRTNMTVYIVLGAINSIILLTIGTYALSLFTLTPEETALLRRLVYISAAGALFTWPRTVISQLLQGAQEIALQARVQALQSVMDALLVATVYLSGTIGIEWFFAGQVLIPFTFFGRYLRRLRIYTSLKSCLLPGWNWVAYRPVVLYSLGLFLMTLAQVSFIQLRPIIIAIRSLEGSGAVADYRILFGISQFFELTSMWIVAPLVPAISHALAKNDNRFVERILLDGSRYVWLMVALPLFGVILSSKYLLTAYVGPDYAWLSPWLRIWLLFMGLGIFRAPVGAAVLAAGKIKVFIAGTWMAMLLSVGVCWFYTPKYGVGGAVFATSVYIFTQFAVSTFYLLPVLFKINPLHYLWRCLRPGLLTGAVTAGISIFVLDHINFPSVWIALPACAVLGTTIYAAGTFIFFEKPGTIMNHIRRLKNGVEG